MADMLERIPPQDIDAETAVLGSMLIDRDAIPQAAAILAPEDYYRDAHRRIHAAIIAIAGRNEPVDLITLPDELRRQGSLEAAGGAAYLMMISQAVPTSANVESYAGIVKACAMRRAYITAGSKIVALGYDGADQPEELAEKVESMIYFVGAGRRDNRLCYLSEAVTPVLDEIFAVKQNGITRGIPTGFYDLDSRLGGLYPGDLIIIAGRPGMGKTSFALNIVDNICVAGSGNSSVIFSMEMTREQLVTRQLSARSGINSETLRRGYTTEAQDKQLMTAAGEIYDMRVAIDDTTGQTIMGMKAACRRIKAEKGLHLVVADFLQLIEGKGENRLETISKIVRDLKGMARELDVPVVVLSQLSRAVERQDDKRPRLHDLRESGEIEQTADIVLFLYREDYYHITEEGYEPDHRGQVTIAKNRHGATSQFYLQWDAEHTAFRNLDWRR